MLNVDEIIKPFEPFIKRFGFGYVHFKNDTGLLAKEFGKVAKELWSKNRITYEENVKEWCQRHCTNYDVIKLVCDHIDEKSGLICTGGRCNKCNEIV